MRYVSLTALLLTSACAVGPDYQRPSISIPDSFKEATPAISTPTPTPVAADEAVPGAASASDFPPKIVLAEALQPASEIEKPVEKLPEVEKTSVVEKQESSSLHKAQFGTAALTKFSTPKDSPLPEPVAPTDNAAATASSIEAPVADTRPVQSADVSSIAEPKLDTVVENTAPGQPIDALAAVAPPIMIPPADTKPSNDTPETATQLQPAQPQEEAARGQWWSVFDDSVLNALEEQVASHNQTVQASEAAFHQARALVAEYRAAYFPTVTGDASMSRGKAAHSSASQVSSDVRNSYNASLGASWVPDFWGRVRRQMEAGKATAEEGAANLAVATLSAQTELATDYLSLRIADEQKRLLERTVAAYSKALYITENQYKAGIVARSDVLQAKVQLDTAQAQLVDVGVQRAQYEHAIAVLIGKPPAQFSLVSIDMVPALPDTPEIVPSQLMERRPDVAASERSVIAANAQIGVAEAAYFPDITLAASGGYGDSKLAQWFTLPSRFWSVGPSLAETLFDGGLRSAQTEAAIASYDQTVANYRQTVLTAFQEVEDNLASLRILAEESEVLESAVEDASDSAEVSMNQYKAGTASYLNVVTAQTALLNAQLSALNIRKQRLLAATTLIENVGGGWNVAALSDPDVTEPETTPISILPPSRGNP